MAGNNHRSGGVDGAFGRYTKGSFQGKDRSRGSGTRRSGESRPEGSARRFGGDGRTGSAGQEWGGRRPGSQARTGACDRADRGEKAEFARPRYQEYEYREERPAEPARAVMPEETVPDSQYILTGRNPIREALKNGRDLEKLLVQKGELSGSAREIISTAKERKILVQTVEKKRLDEIAPQHQGLIAFASAYRYATLEDILRTAEERNEPPFIILLDGITDPHNLGAIIRTAECAGAHGVIVPQHRSTGLTPAAVKASAGAVEYLKVARVANLNQCIEELKEKNVWIYAVTMNGQDYRSVDFRGPVALVVGAEGSGISSLTEKKCDFAVSLPMKGKLDSLNASVAAGIMMYAVMEKRGLA